jgi:hypothetical protein
MRRIRLVAISAILLTATVACEAKLSKQKPKSTPSDFELELATKFELLGRYDDARAHYANAAKDPAKRATALEGLERVTAAQVGEQGEAVDSELSVARIAEARDDLGSAASHYLLALKAAQSVGTLRANEQLQARAGLERLQRKADQQMIVRSARAIALYVLPPVVVLLIAVRMVSRRRRSIQVLAFVGPTDQDTRKIGFWISYARAQRDGQSSDLSAKGPLTAPLAVWGTLPESSDDIPDLGDTEILGVKIPLSTLSRLVPPRVSVTGGFTTQGDSGIAYAIIQRYPSSWRRPIVDATITRFQSPSTERDDFLSEFAYEVWIEALTSYAG